MNNKSLIILLVLTTFLVTGCKETHNRAIDLAYYLTATAPDSALSVLNGVDSFFKAKHGSADFVGSLCSANSLHMFILPDGKVTICEQLYWNKNFLIGDLAKMSISEVWNSPRALYLAHRQRNDYSSDSYCHKCKIFDTCKANLNDCTSVH
jgi:radical SAM protein with 4Fe4S-binding SPASM domain